MMKLNKKAKRILWISIPCVIALIIAGITFANIFGRSNEMSAKEAQNIISESIQNTFEATIAENKAFISDAIETASVTVLSTTQSDENTVVAHCKIKSKDAYNSMKKIAEEYGTKNISVSELLDAYSKELEQSNYVGIDMDIILYKENEKWNVEYSYEVMNALMGGYLQYNYEIIEQLEEEE